MSLWRSSASREPSILSTYSIDTTILGISLETTSALRPSLSWLPPNRHDGSSGQCQNVVLKFLTPTSHYFWNQIWCLQDTYQEGGTKNCEKEDEEPANRREHQRQLTERTHRDQISENSQRETTELMHIGENPKREPPTQTLQKEQVRDPTGNPRRNAQARTARQKGR